LRERVNLLGGVRRGKGQAFGCVEKIKRKFDPVD